MAEQPMTITVEEAARWLKISRGLAYEAIHRGEIPAIQIGKRFLVPRIALQRMLEGAGAHEGERKIVTSPADKEKRKGSNGGH